MSTRDLAKGSVFEVIIYRLKTHLLSRHLQFRRSKQEFYHFCCSADDIRDTRSHSTRDTLSQPFSINMEELTPLDLIFMQLREGGRQEFLELMFHVSRLLNLNIMLYCELQFCFEFLQKPSEIILHAIYHW